LGNLYMDQKKFPEAAAEFEQAGDADWDLARVYSAMKQPDKALPHLARLRQTSPTNFDVLLMLGQTLIIKKDYPAAQSALLEAIRVQPQTPDPYVDLANVFYLQERYPETLQALDRLAGLGPGKVHETPWSAFLRAITLDKLGVVQPALDSYKRFLSISTGQYPDQEFQARQRVKVLTLLLEKGMKHRK
jgi:predicted Zn-dependent protease